MYSSIFSSSILFSLLRSIESTNSMKPLVEPSADPAVKPWKPPVPAHRVRRPNPKTGVVPPVKVYGFPFTDNALDTWCTNQGLFLDMDISNRASSAMQEIGLSTPWCDWDFSILWAIVKGPPEDDFGMLKVLIIGSNETPRDLRHAHNAARVAAVREIIGDLGIEPAWYWRDHSYD